MEWPVAPIRLGLFQIVQASVQVEQSEMVEAGAASKIDKKF